MNNLSFFIKKADIARSFSMAAKTYDKHALIQQEIGLRLLERVEGLREKPKTILDLGQGTGFFTRRLQQKFPGATVIGVDIAFGMCEFAANQAAQYRIEKKSKYLCADAQTLPFKNNSIDLIFSNFTLQWCYELKATLKELKRVLKPNGVLLFTTLGPDTLQELRHSFARVDDNWHVNPFSDMHDIGDFLLNLQYHDPVMDRELITLHYQSVEDLLIDLKATGAHNMNQYRQEGLTSPKRFQKMLEAYEKFKKGNAYPASFEVLYGHALKTKMAVYRQEADGTVFIPGDAIPVL